MCEYCDLVSGDKKDFGDGQHDILKIERHNDSYLIGTDSSIDFDDEREINYCPICRKKVGVVMIAKGDVTYCESKECKECWRHESKWEFEADRFYSFIEKCAENHKLGGKNV